MRARRPPTPMAAADALLGTRRWWGWTLQAACWWMRPPTLMPSPPSCPPPSCAVGHPQVVGLDSTTGLLVDADPHPHALPTLMPLHPQPLLDTRRWWGWTLPAACWWALPPTLMPPTLMRC